MDTPPTPPSPAEKPPDPPPRETATIVQAFTDVIGSLDRFHDLMQSLTARDRSAIFRLMLGDWCPRCGNAKNGKAGPCETCMKAAKYSKR